MNSSSAENPSLGDDEKGIIEILKSMGIDQFDPMVPVALNEYARRFVAELLCDAKDYSIHAKKTDLDAEDVKLAIKLSDVKISGVDQSQSVIEEIKAEINKQSLIDFADPNAIMTRYPPDMFMQRSYTYVPGEDAYKEFTSKTMN
eukprot:gene5287-5670_t